MNNSYWVICLGGNYNQVPYLNELKKMGYSLVLFDKNINAPAIKLAYLYIQSSYDDLTNMKNIIYELKGIVLHLGSFEEGHYIYI